MSSENLRTVSEVAEQLRLSDRAVYDLCRSGKLRHLRLGQGLGAIRVTQADVDAYKDGCVVGTREAQRKTTQSDKTGDN